MQRFKRFRKDFLLPVLFLVTGTLVSCVNDLESIKKVTLKANDPDDKTSELYMTYTDSGYAKVRLYAKLAETFSKPERVVQFKDGVKVEFYNEQGELESILTALYGEIREEDGTMLVRDSVRMFNPIRNQRLETEVLYWNQKDSTIFTDKMVVVRTPKATSFAKGIVTKQDFSHYRFIGPEGKFDID